MVSEGARPWGRGRSEFALRLEFVGATFVPHRGKKKPININILGGTVSGTNRNCPALEKI